MNKEIIIADASPLIAFGRINLLTLIKKLFGTIIIPNAVANECLMDMSLSGAKAIYEAINKKIIKIDASSAGTLQNSLLDILDEGESEAIKLALVKNAPLLIDEQQGRKIAKSLQIKIIGTVGVLLLAKKNNHLKKIKPIIEELKQSNYRLSNSLVKEVLEKANEFN